MLNICLQISSNTPVQNQKQIVVIFSKIRAALKWSDFNRLFGEVWNFITKTKDQTKNSSPVIWK